MTNYKTSLFISFTAKLRLGRNYTPVVALMGVIDKLFIVCI